ncbi:MAG: type IV secretion system DNA-binding domain-containing protein [Candidatus Vogelbacteria bacterium]|nr:type IV secretion system DNA-binding domain-containing protein [Candidatus Vogelbacteria bacterium]
MADEKNKDITYFAETDFRSKNIPFGIKALDRARHIYVIGKTGMGKSTLLENMTAQDIAVGNGVGYMDPHGSSAELFLDYIPKERIEDVIYFAPYDLDFPIAFNVMEDVGKDQRHLVANGLMAAFKKIWPDVWSARMEYISMNIILALLEYPGSTLLGVNRMLSDKAYRKKVVENCTDPVVKSFWVDEFAKYSEKLMVEASSSIQNKFGQFVSNPLIRNIVGQPKSTFDIRDVMDGKKILIMNLSKGRMGELNANLIGGMLITKIYLAAMSRAGEDPMSLKKLAPFYFFVDEFQSFVNDSFKDILSEARKYKLCLTLAHQYIEQVPEEVRDAVFGNVGTTIAFRVGPLDSEMLEKVFAPKFVAEDLVNLGFAQIYLSLMIDGVGSAPFSAKTLPPLAKPAVSYRQQVIDFSRKTYARSRADVEEEIRKWHEAPPVDTLGGGALAASGGDKFSKPAFPKPSAFATSAPQDRFSSPSPGLSFGQKPPQSAYVKPFANKFSTPPARSVQPQAFSKPAYSTNKPLTPETRSQVAKSQNFSEQSAVKPPQPQVASVPMSVNNQRPASFATPQPAAPKRFENQVLKIEQETIQPKMSLSDLSRGSNGMVDKTKSTGKNIGDLKNAIAQAIKTGQTAPKKIEIKVDIKPEIEDLSSRVIDDPAQDAIKTPVSPLQPPVGQQTKTADEQVKEIPEDVLRKILDTETNKG